MALACRAFILLSAHQTENAIQASSAMLRKKAAILTKEDQIAAEKARIEAQVAKLPPGPQKDGLLKKLRQLETASHINDWLSSPGLQPPRPV